jgi:uncharacterized protein (DUF433 family)
MVAAPINLISLDERGIAYIAGTKMKVAQIARERVGLAYTPEDIVDSHAHLTLAQVYAALSYYYGHRDEIDTLLREQDAYYDDFCQRNEQRTSREELEARLASIKDSTTIQASSALRIAEEGAQYD